MRPILVQIPSKLLFVVALLVAAGVFVRDLILRRREPSRPFSSTPLYALVGAELLVGLKGGSWTPSAAGFAHPWSPVPIYAYGVMLGTSLVAGWFLAMRFAKQDGIDQQEAGTIYMWTAVWAIIGSRVLWWITTPEATLWDLPLINRGGLVAYGGMIGGFLASWYGCRKRRIPLLKWADVSAPSVVLGTGITRIGCFLFGCDYGSRTSLPWAVRFPGPNPLAPNGSPAWQDHVRNLGLPQTSAYSYPIHPTQLYECLVGLALFGLLMWLRHHRKFSGQVFLGWVFGYGIMRPIIEIFRADEDRGIYHLPFSDSITLSTSQYIGIVSVLLGLVLLFALVRKYRRDPASLRLWEMQTLAPAGGPDESRARARDSERERATPNKRRKRR